VSIHEVFQALAGLERSFKVRHHLLSACEHINSPRGGDQGRRRGKTSQAVIDAHRPERDSLSRRHERRAHHTRGLPPHMELKQAHASKAEDLPCDPRLGQCKLSSRYVKVKRSGERKGGRREAQGRQKGSRREAEGKQKGSRREEQGKHKAIGQGRTH